MTIVVIVAIVVIMAAAAAAAIEYNRRRKRAEFGPEYDVLVAQEGGRRAADREISRRQRAYSKLDLRPLQAEDRARQPEDWRRVQESFVDDPAAALSSADALVLRLARTRGYPSGDELIELLSIPHTGTITGYREAIRVREAAEQDPHSVSTEQMRQAFQGYGAIFEDLLAAADTEAGAGAQPAQSSEVREPVSLEERR